MNRTDDGSSRADSTSREVSHFLKKARFIGCLFLLWGCASAKTIPEKGIPANTEWDSPLMSSWVGEYEGIGATMIASLENVRGLPWAIKGWNEGLNARLIISYAGEQSINIEGGLSHPTDKISRGYPIGFIPLKNIQIDNSESFSGISEFNFGSTIIKEEYSFTKNHGFLDGYINSTLAIRRLRGSRRGRVGRSVREVIGSRAPGK